MAADDRAIVVGISHYPGLDTEETKLAGPENDARDFIEWLTSSAGGDVPNGSVCRILSSDYSPAADPSRAKPTTEALREAIDQLHDLGKNHGGRAGRRLYLFLAGHGFAPDVDEAALLMANAAKGRTGHHFPGRLYANWFRQAEFFKEVVLFMDCCRENYPRSPLQKCHLEIVTGHKEAHYCYGFATSFSRPARESADSDGVVHGVFTTALLAGLRYGPLRGDKVYS